MYLCLRIYHCCFFHGTIFGDLPSVASVCYGWLQTCDSDNNSSLDCKFHKCHTIRITLGYSIPQISVRYATKLQSTPYQRLFALYNTFQMVLALRSLHSVPCLPRLLMSFRCLKYPFAYSSSSQWYSSYYFMDEWELRFDLEQIKNWASTWHLLIPKDRTSGKSFRCSTWYQQQRNTKLTNEEEDSYTDAG